MMTARVKWILGSYVELKWNSSFQKVSDNIYCTKLHLFALVIRQISSQCKTNHEKYIFITKTQFQICSTNKTCWQFISNSVGSKWENCVQSKNVWGKTRDTNFFFSKISNFVLLHSLDCASSFSWENSKSTFILRWCTLFNKLFLTSDLNKTKISQMPLLCIISAIVKYCCALHFGHLFILEKNGKRPDKLIWCG